LSDSELELASTRQLPESSSGQQEELRPCWLEIGVYGRGDCVELKKHIHCRNCPVYSHAALRLLDRPLSKSYRQEWSAHFAEEERRTPPTRSSAVVFRIHLEWLALPTQAFQEVAENRRIHSLPHRRNNIVMGLVNIRGELLICVALDRLLGLEERGATDPALTERGQTTATKRLLVVTWDSARLVFPVDEVEGIYRFQTKELKEPPATLSRSDQTHTRGLLLSSKRTVGLLNADSLFPALNRNLS
jgi:chemotaxis-related protein WspD